MKLFILQLRGELRKLFARKRTYIGFGAFLLLELVVLGLMHMEKAERGIRRMIERAGYGFEDYFSGLTLAFIILKMTIFFLGGLYLALIAGDMVAKEVEDGTMRMTLCRPVSRWRLLAVKAAGCGIYTFALVLFIGISALIAGLIDRGAGGLFAEDFVQGLFALYEFGPGLVRYLAALPLLGLSLLTVSAIGFMFSCFNMKPAAATILTLSILFVDLILSAFPYFESFRPYFFSQRMGVWVDIFRTPIPVWQMVEDYVWLFAINATLLAIGMVSFQTRDFKS
ncbi:MAG TPA: ABC transporter permease subunit [Chthoniobacteraceae bacterium]|jgi:ABC-2 type transport system permease protein